MPDRPYLLVVVGTTNFDRLVRAVDNTDVVHEFDGCFQIGTGEYEPSSLPFVRFAPTLDPYYARADVVVAHGGLAVTVEVLKHGVPLVSVSNSATRDDHQNDLLAEFERQGRLLWCRDLADLDSSIRAARLREAQPYPDPECEIHLHIGRFLQERLGSG